MSSSPPRVPDDGCQRALLALANGELAVFRGTDGCTRADADRAFGVTGRADEHGLFGKQQTYRVTGLGWERYLQIAFAADGALDAIVIHNAEIPADAIAALGAPEARHRSGLGPDHEQWVYASRGLTLHVDVFDQRGAVLVAYRRMTAAEFLARPYAWKVTGDDEL